MNFKTISSCPVCDSQNTQEVWQLPRLPVTENFAQRGAKFSVFEQITIDQSLMYCRECDHAYLQRQLSPQDLYSINSYSTFSASSHGSYRALSRFADYVRRITKSHSESTESFANAGASTLIDIGCNDCTLLSILEDDFHELWGVDPLPSIKHSISKHVNIVSAGVEEFDFRRINKSVGSQRVFVSSHTLEHIAEPRNLLRRLSEQTSDEDIFIFQFPSLDLLRKNLRFFQVHNQHFHYFSSNSVKMILEMNGFEILDLRFDQLHYGAIQVAFRKASIKECRTFESNRLCGDSNQLIESIDTFEKMAELFDRQVSCQSGKIIGYGAGLMYPIMCYHFRSIASLESVADDDPAKHMSRYLGTRALIVPFAEIARYSTVILCSPSSEETYSIMLSKLLDKNTLTKCQQLLLPFSLIAPNISIELCYVDNVM